MDSKKSNGKKGKWSYPASPGPPVLIISRATLDGSIISAHKNHETTANFTVGQEAEIIPTFHLVKLGELGSFFSLPI